MIDLISKRIESVIDIVFVANTPDYLYKNMRSLLADISGRISLDQIIDELQRELANDPTHDLYRAAYSYALFILMTYKEYSDVKDQLDWVRASKLRWIEELTFRYERTRVPSKLLTIEITPKITEPTYTTSTNDTTNSDIAEV